MKPGVDNEAMGGLWSAIMIYTMVVALAMIVIGAINGSAKIVIFGVIAFLLALAGFRENFRDSDS